MNKLREIYTDRNNNKEDSLTILENVYDLINDNIEAIKMIENKIYILENNKQSYVDEALNLTTMLSCEKEKTKIHEKLYKDIANIEKK